MNQKRGQGSRHSIVHSPFFSFEGRTVLTGGAMATGTGHGTALAARKTGRPKSEAPADLACGPRRPTPCSGTTPTTLLMYRRRTAGGRGRTLAAITPR